MQSLRYLFIGAEKLTYDLVKRSFESIEKNCRLFNMYGPTETTIISAVLEIYRENHEKFAVLSSVPIGVPVANSKLLVLDKFMKLCPTGVTGELVIAGDGLSHGYLNRPELTAEKFMSQEFLSHGGVGSALTHQRIYRTGDLVRRLPDGNIEFIGRIDYQVKIRGFRIELGEIENRLLSNEAVREAVVIDREGETGEKYLCAYVVLGDSEDETGDGRQQELKEYLSQTLPDYMVPAYFVAMDNIPLNPNGKVNRSELPLPEIVDTTVRYTAPRNKIEEKMSAIWAEVLGLAKEKIGIDDNFFHLGGHSLKAIQLTAKIYDEFNARVTLAELFRNPSVRGLAKYIEESVVKKSPTVRIAEKKEYYTLTSVQRRFYVLQQIEPGNTTYNMMIDAAVLEGKLDSEKMRNSVEQLIERHETLRTSFIVVNDEPVQYIHEPGSIRFKMEYYEVSKDQDANTVIEQFRHSFDLSRAPLLRLGLAKLAEGKYLFLFDMHHIISDAISFSLTYEEFMKIYAGKQETLPALSLQYKDYSEWQKLLEMSGEIKKQEEFWLKEFSGRIPHLNMPLDYDRPKNQSFSGDRVRFEVSSADANKLRKYAGDEDATLFMVLLALTCVFLAKLSGKEDIVVGTPAVGRKYSELYNIIGVFINTLALRNYPIENKSFAQFLKEVKERTIAAFDNQDYQFEDLVQKVGKTRDSSRNPIFDVLFSYTRIGRDETSSKEENSSFVDMKPYGYKTHKSLLDLVLVVNDIDESGELIFGFTYCTKLFKKETMEKFVTYFKEIITAVSENKTILLKDIKISHDLGEAKSTAPDIEFGF
jgi:tyrocidine synthetase-3